MRVEEKQQENEEEELGRGLCGHSVFCILYSLIYNPNYEIKLNVRSWAVNRMDVLGEQRNTWQRGKPC